MAHVYIDRDGSQFTVRVMTGARGDKRFAFATHREAAAFVESKMGRKGMVIDSSLMTPEQRAAHQERQRRSRELLASLESKLNGAQS